MKSSPYDFRQHGEDAVWRLPEVALSHLPLTLLAELMDSLVRLAQILRNISRPSSSHAPCDATIQ